MSYQDGFKTPVIALANAAVSSAADIAQIVGPTGKKGRIRSVSLVTTTATTAAASAINIGTVADPDAYGIIAVPITAIDTAIQLTKAQLAAILDLPADTVILISGGGEATAGALDIIMDIEWF
jgi:hypothetical protein